MKGNKPRLAAGIFFLLLALVSGLMFHKQVWIAALEIYNKFKHLWS